MNFQARYLLVFLPILAVGIGCDGSEDPFLLNPPLPDSTQVRLVNLVSDETVTAWLGGIPIATDMAPFRSSGFTSFLTKDRINMDIIRTSRRDTLRDQLLAISSLMTYFIMGDAKHTIVYTALSGKQDVLDLTERKLARIMFINAINDSAQYLLRQGCVSGDTLITGSFYTQVRSTETASTDLSLYLFNAIDSTGIPATTARLHVDIGAVTYVVATRNNGQTRLLVLGSSKTDPSGALQELPQEDRNNANIELLNALSEGSRISASMLDGGQITNDLAPLAISSLVSIQACVNLRGDSLRITPVGAQAVTTPIRLTVGSRTLVAVYGSESNPKAVTLDRNTGSVTAGKIYLRGVNLSTVTPLASISVGAGAPEGVAEGFRPFGSVPSGMASSYVEMPTGEYPLILFNGTTGQFVVGGLEQFESGYYTVFVVDRAGVAELQFLRDDAPALALDPIDAPGSIVTVFNMMPDITASFTAGTLTIPNVAYRYTSSSILPFTVTTVTSNAGDAGVTPSNGGTLIGATGSGSDRRLLAFRSPVDTPPTSQAAIRFLNAANDLSDVEIHIGTVQSPPVTTLTFGIPTSQFLLDDRKYSFIFTRVGDTTPLTRLDGVELIRNRNYILVIGPARQDEVIGDAKYATLLLQE